MFLFGIRKSRSILSICDNSLDVEILYTDSILTKNTRKLLLQNFTDFKQILRNCKVADAAGNHDLGNVAGYPFTDYAAEHTVIQIRKLFRAELIAESDQLLHKFDGLGDNEIHSPAGADVHKYFIDRVFELYVARNPPRHGHLMEHVNIEDLTGERTLPSCRHIDYILSARKIGGVKDMTSCFIKSILHTIDSNQSLVCLIYDQN